MHILILQIDDWTVLYRDGEVFGEQNHSLDWGHLADAVGGESFTFERHFLEGQLIEAAAELGDFPGDKSPQEWIEAANA